MLQVVGLIAVGILGASRIAMGEVAPDGNGGVFVDIANLQWWQTLLGILGVAGLSPAPWILGLATGKIQFTAVARKDFDRQLVEKDAAHQRELAARDLYHQGLMAGEKQRYADLERANQANTAAAERNRERADEVTDAALEMTKVVEANTHIMRSLKQAERIVAEEREA